MTVGLLRLIESSFYSIRIEKFSKMLSMIGMKLVMKDPKKIYR